MLSAASCSLSACGSMKLKRTLVLIRAIFTVYPGPLFKFPATNTKSALQNLELEFEHLNCLHDSDKATAMTFRLWLIFGRSQV